MHSCTAVSNSDCDCDRCSDGADEQHQEQDGKEGAADEAEDDECNLVGRNDTSSVGDKSRRRADHGYDSSMATIALYSTSNATKPTPNR